MDIDVKLKTARDGREHFNRRKRVIRMDPVSMSASGMNYTDMMIERSRLTQGKALLQLLDVVNQAVAVQAHPLANLSNVGNTVDVYA